MLLRVSDGDCSTDSEGIADVTESPVVGLTVVILLVGEALCISPGRLLP